MKTQGEEEGLEKPIIQPSLATGTKPIPKSSSNLEQITTLVCKKTLDQISLFLLPLRVLLFLGSGWDYYSMATIANAPPTSGLGLVPTTTAASSHRLSVIRVSLRSPFLGKPVGELRANAIRLARADRLRRNGGGGILVPRMNLFSRFARVIKSYVNAIVSAFEDPEKILEQSVLEMNEDLTKMRQATAQVLASQKQLENKYKAAEKASEDWYRRAQLALSRGDEDLAREALKRRKAYADNANVLKAQLEQQSKIVDNLVSNTKLLESKIQEAKSKKDTLKARAQSARTATKVSEMVGKVNTSSALAAFEKMEEKVLAMEAEADALNQLTSDELEGKFALLESSSVDEDLANLKKELSGSSKRGELPPGRTVVSSSAAPFLDLEVEKELNELRRRANDY